MWSKLFYYGLPIFLLYSIFGSSSIVLKLIHSFHVAQISLVHYLDASIPLIMKQHFDHMFGLIGRTTDASNVEYRPLLVSLKSAFNELTQSIRYIAGTIHSLNLEVKVGLLVLFISVHAVKHACFGHEK